ncbi:MAG: class I SAM-dependent methyltransferase [Patescibacteria group bacterium]
MNKNIYITSPSSDYELLDSGDGMKLERFGRVVVARPDPQALWRKGLPQTEWLKADAQFAKEGRKNNTKDSDAITDEGDEKGRWVTTPGVPEKWEIKYGDVTMGIKLTPFKHTGLFPEQLSNWKWSADLIRSAVTNGYKGSAEDGSPVVLNLFGYTGGATLSASVAGAHVTHVDASKAAITWANDNASVSGLKEKPIRWILEDAAEFVKREVRRGRRYDAVIMDPPSFGRGSKGEIWKIEEDFLPLVEDCFKLLSDKPLFFIINGYAAGYSSIAYENNLKALVGRFGGSVEGGELVIQDTGPLGRLLPCGIVARWKNSL